MRKMYTEVERYNIYGENYHCEYKHQGCVSCGDPK